MISYSWRSFWSLNQLLIGMALSGCGRRMISAVAVSAHDTQRTWNMYEKGELSMMSVCDRSRPSRLRSCVAQWVVSARADNGARGGAP